MKKKIGVTLSVIVFLVLGFIAYLKQPLGTYINISGYETPKYVKSNTPAFVDSFSLSIVETGWAEAPGAMMYKGGDFLNLRKLSHIAVLIQHPNGTFVFDTGLGDSIESQFNKNVPFFDKQLTKFEKKESLKDALLRNNYNPDVIDFIIASHLHFDHVGGIMDFPKIPVLVTKEEYDHGFGTDASAAAFIKEQYNSQKINWKFLNFKPVAYEVFSESVDLFNDGTVVLVKLFGHTKGSIGMFVNLSSGKRYFFTGDLTAVKEAFIYPSEKHPVFRAKVDFNRDKTAETIVKVHHLMELNPSLKIVPAHDFNAQKNIAHFPTVEY